MPENYRKNPIMPLTDEEKKLLLKIARETIEATARRLPLPALSPPLRQALKENRGAFVTLNKDSGLRGCIGVFTGDGPLYKTVQDMAEAAARRDNRFSPVEADELKDILIEISALTPLRLIKDVSEIEVGRHGIYIVKGFQRGVLLPQVAVEHHMSRDEFLDNTCLKAGLAQGCWKRGVEIYIFEAEVFGEG
ncbi:MAG: AmmeMemoRadiSam system protein A [Deltaproteobacteria bacterium]